MKQWILDLEGNGYLEDITKIWCIVCLDLESDTKLVFTNQLEHHTRLRFEQFEWFLNETEPKEFIMHNGLAYDAPVIEKVLGYKIKQKIVDTLVISRVQWPDRPGGHALSAWGDRLGFPKGDHKDFSRFSEEMLIYCEQDCLITKKVLLELDKERLENVGI